MSGAPRTPHTTEVAARQARVDLPLLRDKDKLIFGRAWYERLALVLMNHYNASPIEKEDKLREAVQVCIDGLLDEDTHLSTSSGRQCSVAKLMQSIVCSADNL